MSLLELIDNTRTDKNTTHSYIEVYENLFSGKKDSAKHILEIGIYYGGGSIKLWHDYFHSANIYAIDIIPYEDLWNELKGKDRITLIGGQDAYNNDFVQ
jgi:predicted O-methyltransferase YrrM